MYICIHCVLKPFGFGLLLNKFLLKMELGVFLCLSVCACEPGTILTN